MADTSDKDSSTGATISTAVSETTDINVQIAPEEDKSGQGNKKKAEKQSKKETKQSKKEKKLVKAAEKEARKSVKGKKEQKSGDTDDKPEKDGASGSDKDKEQDAKIEDGLADGEFGEEEEEEDDKLDCYYVMLAVLVGLVIFGVLIYFTVGSMLRVRLPYPEDVTGLSTSVSEESITVDSVKFLPEKSDANGAPLSSMDAVTTMGTMTEEENTTVNFSI